MKVTNDKCDDCIHRTVCHTKQYQQFAVPFCKNKLIKEDIHSVINFSKDLREMINESDEDFNKYVASEVCGNLSKELLKHVEILENKNENGYEYRVRLTILKEEKDDSNFN